MTRSPVKCVILKRIRYKSPLLAILRHFRNDNRRRTRGVGHCLNKRQVRLQTMMRNRHLERIPPRSRYSRRRRMQLRRCPLKWKRGIARAMRRGWRRMAYRGSTACEARRSRRPYRSDTAIHIPGVVKQFSGLTQLRVSLFFTGHRGVTCCYSMLKRFVVESVWCRVGETANCIHHTGYYPSIAKVNC